MDSQNQTKTEISIYDELYVSRLLIFMETGPQTNLYGQVLLTKEQFKKMSDCLVQLFPHNVVNKKEEFVIPMSDKDQNIDESFDSYYPPEKIK